MCEECFHSKAHSCEHGGESDLDEEEEEGTTGVYSLKFWRMRIKFLDAVKNKIRQKGYAAGEGETDEDSWKGTAEEVKNSSADEDPRSNETDEQAESEKILRDGKKYVIDTIKEAAERASNPKDIDEKGGIEKGEG